MSTFDNVPDSTDWLSTSLSGFAAVEAALRCQVCKDFYKTPMVTSCSHTFCSLCIRRALSNDGKCPLCRATEQELKLRSNWSMEETVEAFCKVRESALNIARNGGSASRSPKRKAQDSGALEAVVVPETKRLRTSARLSRNRREGAPATVLQAEEYDDQEVDDDGYVPEAQDGLVPCPSCRRKMKDWQVFGHLESCPGPTANQAISETSGAAFGLVQTQRRQRKAVVERLPPLNYSMLKEQALRKKMADLGISNQGPRILLEKRHKEWLTLWNANCDAALPKKRSGLLHDLDAWERTQGGRAPTTSRMAESATIIKDKEFDGAAWAAKHDDSFKGLIASARKSRREAKGKAKEGESPMGNVSQGRPTELLQPDSSSLLHTRSSEAAGDPPAQRGKPDSYSRFPGAPEPVQVGSDVGPESMMDPKTLHGDRAELIDTSGANEATGRRSPAPRFKGFRHEEESGQWDVGISGSST